LHAEALVVDAHADILCDVRVRRRAGETQVVRRRHLPRLLAGGFNVVVLALYLTPYMPESALRETLLMLDDLHQEIAESADELYLVRGAADLVDGRRSDRLAILLSLEGAEPIGLDLGILRLLHQLGLRALGLTWARRNLLGDGNREEHTGGGLTHFGRTVVRECSRLGILVDVSHLSTAGFWDVLRLIDGPIIASHSNARALCDHPRNLTDDQLRALAAGGGVVGLNACPDFVDRTQPTLDRLLDHAGHMAAVMGPEHVGLGLDFLEYLPGYEETRLSGLADASEAATITARLAERGVSEHEIRDLLGGNWLRVWQRVLG
jgi:membrane dipeptidase